MKRREGVYGWGWIVSGKAMLWIWSPIVLTSYFHYTTGMDHHWLHDIFRRLYYVPIVLGAFIFGLKGALAASLLASAVYAPHAFDHLVNLDPAHRLEKLLEVMLYNVVAVITGTLADRERAKRIRLETAMIEMKRLEEEKIGTARLKALGELSAGLAHEIKNPLSIISNSLYDLQDICDKENEDIQEDISIAREEMRRVQEIILNMLEFSRDSGSGLETVDLSLLISRTLLLLKKDFRERKIETETSIEDGLEVLANLNRLRQILLNLLTNAAQAMPEGGVLRVASRMGRDGFAEIEVRDTGVGIDPDKLPEIFNPFFTTKETGEGTGLGLSIVRSIVERMGGSIGAESKSGEGSVFLVRIPLESKEISSAQYSSTV